MKSRENEKKNTTNFFLAGKSQENEKSGKWKKKFCACPFPVTVWSCVFGEGETFWEYYLTILDVCIVSILLQSFCCSVFTTREVVLQVINVIIGWQKPWKWHGVWKVSGVCHQHQIRFMPLSVCFLKQGGPMAKYSHSVRKYTGLWCLLARCVGSSRKDSCKGCHIVTPLKMWRQAVNIKGFCASVKPKFEVWIPNFMDGIPDFMEKFNTF